MSNKGRTYELDMVRAVNAVTKDRDVFCATLDYSGNAADSDADIVISWIRNREAFYLDLIELKKRTGEAGKRLSTHPFTGSAEGENGLDELRRLATTGPSFSRRWLALKMDNRKLFVLNAEWLLHHVTDGEEGTKFGYGVGEDADVLQPRLTPANHISMRKPTLDEWESSQAGEDDELVLLDRLGLRENAYVEIEGATECAST